MLSVWSAGVFDTRVVSLILNAVPLEGGKQIQCDSSVTVELHRWGEKTNKPTTGTRAVIVTASPAVAASACRHPVCLIIYSRQMKGI